MKFNEMKIGPWLKNWVDENRKNTVWVADTLDVTDRQALKYYQDKPISIARIRQISQGTGVDLFVFLLSEESKAIYDRGVQVIEEERKAQMKREEETQLQMAQREMQEMQKQIGALQEMVAKLSGGNGG